MPTETNSHHVKIFMRRAVLPAVLLMLTAGTLALCTPAQVKAQTHTQSQTITLRTLAQIQQWQDEMNLRDRIETLQGKNRQRAWGTVATARDAATGSALASTGRAGATVKTVLNANAMEAGAPVAEGGAGTSDAVKKAKVRRRPALKLLSVYGPANRLSAEMQDSSGNVQAIEEQDTVGRWIVSNIRHEGVLLHRDRVLQNTTNHDAKTDTKPESKRHDAGIFIAVGESMDDGGQR
jgi:hypothetical protein